MLTKLFSILLSSFILAQSFNINLNDVSKLNELKEHMQFHSSNYGDNIFTFFSKHYGDLKENHTENHQKEDHNKLPFDHSYGLNYTTIYILQKINIFEVNEITRFQTSNFHYQESYTSIEKSDIFQPPKYA